MLEVGTKAPDFTLFNQEGNEVSLSDFWVSESFYIFILGTILQGAPGKPAPSRKILKVFGIRILW